MKQQDSDCSKTDRERERERENCAYTKVTPINLNKKKGYSSLYPANTPCDFMRPFPSTHEGMKGNGRYTCESSRGYKVQPGYLNMIVLQCSINIKL
jgi:hypothetical protein